MTLLVSSLQPIVATSSTKAITCAKAAKYPRYVLAELDALREGPTLLYIENAAYYSCPLLFMPVISRSSIWPSRNGK